MGPDIGALGASLLFFSVTIAQILLSLFVLSYAAYSFLNVLINTAAGDDAIVWPGDPLVDWIWNGWYLAWLLAVWAVPASLTAGLLGLPPSSLRFFLVVAGIVWLIFPVSLLSSLSGASRVTLLRPAIVGLLLQHAGATVGFYVMTGILVSGCVGLAYCAVTGPGLLLPLAAVAGAIGLLIYARLLGRIGLLITPLKSSKGKRLRAGMERLPIFDPGAAPEPSPKASRKPAEPASSRKPVRKKRNLRSPEPDRAYDPWAPPSKPSVPEGPETPAPASEDPYGPVEGTYELAAAESAPSPLAPDLADLDIEGYGVSVPAEAGPPRTPVFATPEENKREEKLAAPRRLPPPPPQPLSRGVFSFPFYPTTLGPLLTLALGVLGVGLLLRAQIALFPF